MLLGQKGLLTLENMEASGLAVLIVIETSEISALGMLARLQNLLSTAAHYIRFISHSSKWQVVVSLPLERDLPFPLSPKSLWSQRG